jgi:hypothetical protein
MAVLLTADLQHLLSPISVSLFAIGAVRFMSLVQFAMSLCWGIIIVT